MRIKDKLENYATVDRVLNDFIAELYDEDLEVKLEKKLIAKGLKEKILRDEISSAAAGWTDVASTRSAHHDWKSGAPAHARIGALQRGETQALVTATLGTADDQQKVETVDGETWKRFMLHYNFPPFSVGEVKFLRGPGRREIGHGALRRALAHPDDAGEENFPYTVRVVSEILESNGSSSMASVCGGSLAMMDAGVPLKAPVAGRRDGPRHERGQRQVRDPLGHRGREDHYGDMDFKVTGTAAGITALQMDIKVSGITTRS